MASEPPGGHRRTRMGIEGADDRASTGSSGPPGMIQVVVNGQATTRWIASGEVLIVGADPGSGIVLADPRVSPRHASIERRGPGWLVHGLDAANPTWLLDATGRAHAIQGELGLKSGELLIGGAQVRLYPPAA